MRQTKFSTISKLILTTIFLLMLSTGSKAIQLANKPTLSEQQDRIFDILLVASSLGGKSFISLLSHRQNKEDKGNGEDE